MKIILKTIKTFIQKIFLTIQLYTENGLANHAAASAYGFLLSLAPTILIIILSFLIFLKPSPQTIADLIINIPFLSGIFDEQWLTGDIITVSKPGIPSVISIISILWATRILALSITRGLTIVFPSDKNRNPFMNSIVIIAIDAMIIICIFFLIFSSRTAIYFYKLFDFFPKIAALDQLITFFILGLASFIAYLFVPISSSTPKKFSAFQGTLLCMFLYACTAIVLSIVTNTARLNFLYGTLGNIIVILINVYFFFNFFFMGAQYSFITDNFDALLFSKLREIRNKNAADKSQAGGFASGAKFFSLPVISNIFSIENNFSKYIRYYKEKEIIFSRNDKNNDIYYLLNGDVEILISDSDSHDNLSSIIHEGSFFGEMSYLLSEERSAATRAKTSCRVLILPPALFEIILKFDTTLNRDIIKNMSHRLKNANEQMIAMKKEI